MSEPNGGRAPKRLAKLKHQPATRTLKANATPRMGQSAVRKGLLRRWEDANRGDYVAATRGYMKFRGGGVL